MESEDMEEEQVGVAFDVRRLPYAYGTKMTEMLIDALFNPAKTSLKHEESPFKMYEPPSPASLSHSVGITPRVGVRSNVNKPAGVVGLGLRGVPPLDRNATIGKRHGSTTTTVSSSMYNTSDSSVHTTMSSSSKSRSRGRGSQSDSHHGHSVAFAVAGGGSGAAYARVPRGTPEGRVDCVGGGNARRGLPRRILDFLGSSLRFFFVRLCCTFSLSLFRFVMMALYHPYFLGILFFSLSFTVYLSCV